MSKAYVIKNKKGEYFMDDICFANFSPYIQNATLYYYKPECIDIIKERTLDNCTIVPITFCEGDLEEENRELKAKLETAEYWNRKYDGLLERVNDIKKAFRHLIKDHIEIINEINGFPLSAEKEEIDEYFDKYIQQAKESENV